MKKAAAAFLVRIRYFSLVLFVVLAALSINGIGRTVIEYDLTKYLSDDTPTKKGLAIMAGSFENTDAINVMFRSAPDAADDFSRKAAEQEGVISVTNDPDSDVTNAQGTYRLVRVLCNAKNAVALDTWMDEALDGVDVEISGGTRSTRAIQEALSGEMPLIMLVSCLFVLAVLLVMNRNLLDCILFFAVIFISILLNMGTNWIFDSISFITFAVASILQLALAMDYSIMMLNAFKGHLGENTDKTQAVRLAVEETLMPVSSSALTTIAGMLSLLFMSFTIGFDIGIVLVKGILWSLLTVFLCMPALLTLSAGRMKKKGHTTAPAWGRRLAGAAVRGRGVAAILLLVVILLGFVAQQGTRYSYTVSGSDPAGERIAEIFGREETLVILYPTARSDEDYEKSRAMIEEILNVRAGDKMAVKGAMSMTTTLGAALEYIDYADLADMLGVSPLTASLGASLLNIRLPMRADQLLQAAADRWDSAGLGTLLGAEQGQQVKDLAAAMTEGRALLEGEEWTRAILEVGISYSDPGAGEAIGSIRKILTQYYGDEWGMTGSLAASDDIATTFSGDLWRVSLITLGAVFAIIAISFRSLWIPLILVCVIQGAIWVNIGFSSLLDGSVFFMCYLICMALQMGATIDYAILMTDHYIHLRQKMAPKEAAAEALARSLRTILTSGLSFVTAGFAVGMISSIYYVSSIGTMLGRGALVSLLLVLFLLPRLLIWLDKQVMGKKIIVAAG